MTFGMLAGPLIMTVAGFLNDLADFFRALEAQRIPQPDPSVAAPAPNVGAFVAGAAVLFSSFIGFDAISQAGGEAKNASKNLPRSIVVAIAVVTLYYIAFTAAVYHAVPWDYIYRVSLVRDVSAPALLTPLLPAWLSVIILLAVTTAILNSIPSVMLANSRMLFAFAEDRVFPATLATIHPVYRTPHHAITLTAISGSLSVLGCHFAGDFFLGVDLLVLSMLLNFILIAIAVITLPRVNPTLYREVAFVRSRAVQVAIAVAGAVLLSALLIVQVVADLTSPTPWYLRSTTVWVVVMLAASVVFAVFWRRLRASGIDPRTQIFNQLPPD